MVIKNRAEQRELEKATKKELLKIDRKIKTNNTMIDVYSQQIIDNNNEIARLRCCVELSRVVKIEKLIIKNESIEKKISKKEEYNNSSSEREYQILRDRLVQIENTKLESLKS